MKSIKRVLFLFIFLLSFIGLFTSFYAFNKLDDLADQVTSSTKSSDTFTDFVIISEFFKELSQLGKDQLKRSVKEIEATEKEPSKLEITLTIGPALGKILDKYLNYQEGTKVTIGSVSKKFSSKYTRQEIEKRIDSIMIDFIVVVLEAELLSDQEKAKIILEDPKKALDKSLLDIIDPLLQTNELFKHIKESILGIIPNPATQTLLKYIIQNDATVQGLIKTPQKLLEHLKILITGDRFKIDPLPASFISDKEITYKITYLRGSETNSQVGTDSQVGPQAKITCDATKYYFRDQCITEAICKSKGKGIYTYIDSQGKRQCGLCPPGTHKLLENGECVKNVVDLNYNSVFVQIMESFFREFMDLYKSNEGSFDNFIVYPWKASSTEKAHITFDFFKNATGKSSKYSTKEYFSRLYQKYFSGTFYESGQPAANQPKIILDNGNQVTVPSDYISPCIVKQYVKNKLLEFLENLLDGDPETKTLVKENPLLNKLVTNHLSEIPDTELADFNSETAFDRKKHNLWQYIYLTEVKSFRGSDGTKIIKPDTYTKAEMTPYLKALLKETNKWKVRSGYMFKYWYFTEKAVECEDSFFYIDQCVTKSRCKEKGLFPYIDEQGKPQCGECPATYYKKRDGNCVLKANECPFQSYLDNGFCIDKTTCEEKGLFTYMDEQGKRQCAQCPVEETHRINDSGKCVLISCISADRYFYIDQCLTKSLCEGEGLFAYTDLEEKNRCGKCPPGTHKVVNDECVKKIVEENYSAEFVQIIESYGRELQKQYELNPDSLQLQFSLDPVSGTNKEFIFLMVYNHNLHQKYFDGKYYQSGEEKTIVLDNGSEMMVPSDYTEANVSQYVKEKVVDFFKKLLDRDSKTIKLVNDNPLLRKIVSLYFPALQESAPTDFNSETPFDSTKHNIWQYIYLKEVSSFSGSGGTEITKPKAYTKGAMTPYLKKIVQESKKWRFFVTTIYYFTERVEECRGSNSFFYNNEQCITKATCEKKGQKAYTDMEGNGQCGQCPETHEENEAGECVLK